MRTLMLVAACVALAGCTSEIRMRNASSGQIATCGPFFDTWTTPERERQCISDYQRQGYERTP